MPRANQIEHSGHRRPFVAPAAVVALGAFAAAANLSDPASARSGNFIGAIAFSPSTGAYGYSYRWHNTRDAEERAMKECRDRSPADDCFFVGGFGNMCGALAVAEFQGKTNDGRPMTLRMSYIGRAEKRSATKAAGLEECRKNMLDPAMKDLCKVIVVVCSDDRK